MMIPSPAQLSSAAKVKDGNTFNMSPVIATHSVDIVGVTSPNGSHRKMDRRCIRRSSLLEQSDTTTTPLDFLFRLYWLVSTNRVYRYLLILLDRKLSERVAMNPNDLAAKRLKLAHRPTVSHRCKNIFFDGEHVVVFKDS